MYHPVAAYHRKNRYPMDSHSDLTTLLVAYGKGDRESLDRLMPKVYDQLKVLAHARLRSERENHTLNTTGLVNEAYVKLVDINRMDFKDRAHFFAMASRQMRRILVDWSRKRNAVLRNPKNKASIDEAMALSKSQADNILELENGLESLGKGHPRAAEILEMKYFGGLTTDDIADIKEISTTTVERDLRFGRAWLASEWGDSQN